MMQDRRTFLKTTALAGAAAATVPFTSMALRAQKAAAGPQSVARGFVFATLRRSDGYGLGVRTNRGILDVVAAEHDLREGAPLTITDVFDERAISTRCAASPIKRRTAISSRSTRRHSGLA